MKTAIFNTFLFFLIQVIGFAQPNIQFGYQLHHAGASHLAIDTLEKAIDYYKLQHVNSKIGEAYQTVSEIYYDAGYPMQFTHAIDSFYHYKQLAYPNEDIYFVEYAAWKVRAYSLEHNYKPAFQLLDSAFNVLKRNRVKGGLIDTFFCTSTG